MFFRLLILRTNDHKVHDRDQKDKRENLRNELQFLIDNNINKQGEYQLTDALQNMLDKGLKFVTNDVKEWLDCGNKNATVNTNQRVLELKKSKEELIDKDIDLVNTEIIPPCYIAKGVKITNSKIGPHVSIGENTTIDNSIISNSIIQSSCLISNLKYNNSMLGSNVKAENSVLDSSKGNELNLGDYSEIIL